jgi:hypothetical protein
MGDDELGRRHKDGWTWVLSILPVLEVAGFSSQSFVGAVVGNRRPGK